MRRKVGWTVAATVLGVLAAFVGLTRLPAVQSSAETGDRCSRGALHATQDSRPVVFDHVAFQIPESWYAVDVCFTTGAVESPVGFIMTAAPGAQCESSPDHTACHAPVAQPPGDGDVVVTLKAVGDPRSSGLGPFEPNATIAARPAMIQYTATEVHALVRLKGRAGWLHVVAELGRDSDQQRRAVLDMLESASYSERDRASVGGPFA